jgi:transmembrane sensor
MSVQIQNDHPASSAHAIRMRAAGWLQRRHFWDWDESNQAELDNWLAESPAHMVAYLRAKSVWNRTERLAALRSDHRDHVSAVIPRRKGLFLARTAAALVFAAIFGIAGARYIETTKQTVWQTPVGGRQTVMLGDGSRIELNTDTVLRVASDGRKAWLDRGEAYFRIVHDSDHPFVVAAAGNRVTDLGTEFLVRSEPDRLKVTLITGRARIDSVTRAGHERNAVLTPGDIAVADMISLSVKRSSPRKVMNEMSWRQGLLNFDNATLGDVADELNRYNSEKLVITDPKVARMTIDASIPTHGVQALTRVAKNFLGLHVEDRGSVVVISR